MQPEDKGYGQDYGKIRLIVDDSKKAAAETPLPFNPRATRSYIYTFDMIQWKTGECLTGKVFKLDWPIGRGRAAKVKFLEIDYCYPESEFERIKIFFSKKLK